jgi:hypothetical protein
MAEHVKGLSGPETRSEEHHSGRDTDTRALLFRSETEREDDPHSPTCFGIIYSLRAHNAYRMSQQAVENEIGSSCIQVVSFEVTMEN